MRNLIVILLTLVAVSGHARSLDPCTPRIEAAPSQLSCSDGALGFGIKFHTLMSGPECPTHQELTSATIEVRVNGTVTEVIEAKAGSFTYTLDDRFDSDSLGLHLRNCVSPMNGGFSIGN